MAQERKIRTSPVSIVAAACACMGWLLVVANGAVAEKLRVGVNLTTIETLPIYLVEREPAGAGIALSGGAIPALTAGNVDVVTNAETRAILRSTTNPEIRVILTVAEYGYRIVARRSAGVRTAMDLRGKKIATSLNSSAHFYIVKTLQSVGLSEPDVTVVGMTPPEMPAALARGVVAAAWGLFRFPASIPDDLLASMVEQEPWMAKNQNRSPRSREAIAALIDASVWREAQG